MVYSAGGEHRQNERLVRQFKTDCSSLCSSVRGIALSTFYHAYSGYPVKCVVAYLKFVIRDTREGYTDYTNR